MTTPTDLAQALRRATDYIGYMLDHLPEDKRDNATWRDCREALAAHESRAQPAVHDPITGSPISAKPIQWRKSDRIEEWFDDNGWGFYISHDDDGSGEPYSAAWGEGDSETFSTLEEAQAWCQETIDSWVRENTVIAIHPAQPASVTDVAAAKRAIEARNHYLHEHPGDAVDAMVAALQAAAPQPAKESE